MTDYVKAFLRLDRRAAEAEEQERTWKEQAAEARWEQARIAHEAVTSGGFSRAAFATAVGWSGNQIGRYVKVWEAHGTARTRPAWADAYQSVMGYDVDDMDVRRARHALRNPDAIREVMRRDPEIARNVHEVVVEHLGERTAPAPRERQPYDFTIDALGAYDAIEARIRRITQLLTDNTVRARDRRLLTERHDRITRELELLGVFLTEGEIDEGALAALLEGGR